jgi:hypothetical protein
VIVVLGLHLRGRHCCGEERGFSRNEREFWGTVFFSQRLHGGNLVCVASFFVVLREVFSLGRSRGRVMRASLAEDGGSTTGGWTVRVGIGVGGG